MLKIRRKLNFDSDGLHKTEYKDKIIFDLHVIYGCFEYSNFLKSFNKITNQKIKTRQEFNDFMDNKFNKLNKKKRFKIIELIKKI